MSQIKKLAGQTAYYGISSILGRVLNFLLLPIWTDRLVANEYGAVTELYAYVALCLIVYTFGMETAFFRFSNKSNKKEAYNSTATAVLATSTIFSSLIFIFSEQIANLLGNGVEQQYVQYMAAILFIDGLIAIPFAKLRLEQKALKFALIKVGVISITIILNLLFIIVLPDIHAGKYLNGLQETVTKIYNPSLGIGYIFIANLLANLLYLPLLWKELLQIRLSIHWTTFKPMLAYALPIFLMGLGGMFNEQGYALILKHVFPEESGISGSDALGVFSGAFKLSVVMMLGIQAFRYAAEPFFFSHAENKEAPALFARIMHYFVVFNIVILVAVALNTELIGDVFLRNDTYKEALFVLPILLIAKLFYGVYVNLSVWFKLTDKTIFGTYYALIGAIITLIGNLLLINELGYYGSAVTALVCYGAMSVMCYLRGRQAFPIPYNFKPLFIYLILAIVVIYGIDFIHIDNKWLSYGFKLLVTAAFAGAMFLLEGRKIQYKST
ncbi:lipopolysaccharide biosynthesis protein [Roseivirga sp. E12]|uniref:lipopolysaccharide biosynthesis protein n=1 Tax=Roseivirga sp. E12 TaxID=2819237 RepID=UPI001ABCAA3C|nr:polysaccharide biosynthesis C-terminal domain-containing protein [Roseivirga sp. E12]MBO3700803.1 polysaccharide biosynthesis C-terminal domain-containing protein [Roseivirga sp. E12]